MVARVCGGNPGDRANCLHNDRVDREGVFGKHGLPARPEKYPRDHVQNIIGPVAQRNRLR